MRRCHSQHRTQAAHPDVLTINTHFVRASQPGTARVTVEVTCGRVYDGDHTNAAVQVLKGGRTTSTVRATLVQHGAVRACSCWFVAGLRANQSDGGFDCGTVCACFQERNVCTRWRHAATYRNSQSTLLWRQRRIALSELLTYCCVGSPRKRVIHGAYLA